jgi:signal transducer and activator of transcription 5B
MSLWAKAQQLPPDSLQQIRAIYGDHFPIEVRHYLAQYIEEKFWSEVEPVPENPQHEQYVAGLVNSLIQEMENKAAVVNDTEYFLTKLKLAEAAKMFRQRYRSVGFIPRASAISTLLVAVRILCNFSRTCASVSPLR